MIEWLSAYREKVEESILATHIGGTGRVTECQVAVIECANGKHGPFLTGDIYGSIHDQRDLHQHIGGKSGKFQGKGPWPWVL